MHFSRFYGVAASWQPCNVAWPKKYETYQKVTLIYVVSQHINTFIIICTRSMYYALWLETWYSYFPWKPLLKIFITFAFICVPLSQKKYHLRLKNLVFYEIILVKVVNPFWNITITIVIRLSNYNGNTTYCRNYGKWSKKRIFRWVLYSLCLRIDVWRCIPCFRKILGPPV